MCGIITVGATAVAVTLDSLKCQIVSFGVVVRFRCHSSVNRYITKQNKLMIPVEDTQKAAEAVMNEKKLR